MTPGRHEPPEDRHAREAREARRHLDRVNEQSEKILGGGTMHDPQSERDDPVEVWGKRLGRGLGVVAVIYLVYHLVTTYFIS